MARLFIIQLIAGILGGIIAAQKRRNILFWALLCFIFPLLTVVITLLPSLRTADTRPIRCPRCGHPKSPGEQLCRYCDQQKAIDLIQCRKCGSFVPEHEDCPVCRQKK